MRADDAMLGRAPPADDGGVPRGDRRSPRAGAGGMRPLPGLQVLRAVAALLVVIAHAVADLGGRGFATGDIEAAFGNFGVDIFFVISGFIIVYASVPQFARPGASWSFLVRRLVRVVPLYWIVSTVYLVVVYALHERDALTLRHVLASYVLLPDPEPQDGADFPFMFVGWTLQFEMFFYLVFAGAMAWRRPVGIALSCGFMLAYVVAGQVTTLPAPFDYWSNSLVLEFVAGCLLAEAYVGGLRLPAALRLGLVAAAVAAVGAVSTELGGWPPLRGLLFGLPAAALVAAVTLAPDGRAWRWDGVMRRLGDMSYSLYLVHLLVFTVTFHALNGVFRHLRLMPPALYGLLLVLLSIGVAFLSFRYVEVPVTRRLRAMLPRS